ncbi:MAG: tetratricopeptide repeat protein [Bacteroidia bacterium]
MSQQKQKKHQSHPPREKAKAVSFQVSRKLLIGLSLIIALFAFVLYSNTLKHQFVLDDYSVIKENQMTKQGTAALKNIFTHSYREGYGNNENNLYRPLTKAMFAIEWQISPDNAHFHHLVNVLFYALCCVLLFFVLIKFTKLNVWLLFVGVMLFAAHPIHTEVVANIKSRDELSSMLFILLSLLSLHKYISSNKLLPLVLSLCCFFLALLSKESAIMYVLMVPLFLHFFTEIPLKGLIKPTALMGAVAIFYIFIHLKVIGSIGIKNIPVIDNSLMYTNDVIQQKATAIYILGKYLLLLLIPHPLSSDYSFNTIPLVTSLGHAGFLIAAALHIFLLYFAIKKFREKNLLSFCIFFYLIAMGLASNLFIMIGTHMAERLLFLPSVAFCLAAVYGLAKLFRIDIFNFSLDYKHMNKALFLVAGIVVLLYSGKTWARNKVWKSDTTLFATDLETVPNSAHMLFYYANNLVNKDSLAAVSPQEKERRLKVGLEKINKALSLYELFPDAHNVAGRIYYEKKDFEKSFKEYDRAMQMNPGKGMYHNNAGTCLFSTGKFEEAAKAFSKAIEIDPYDVDARGNLGSAYGAMGEAYRSKGDNVNANRMFDMAIEAFKEAIKVDPEYESAYRFIGITYNNMGDTVNGKEWLEKSHRFKKNHK